MRTWSAKIRAIAKQEMGHLATVLNLLEAVGGGSYLNRIRFPSATGLYTPPIPFTLEPLTLETISRFVQFETPAHPVALALGGLAPEPVVIEHVGQLYGDIRTGIGKIDETKLFIGRGSGQDQASWSFNITVAPVTNRETAFKAIDSIIVEGEGSPSGDDQSHYGRFRSIQTEYVQEHAANPTFQPCRAVVANPSTLAAPQPDRPDTNAITDPTTKDVAELFNACYTTLLLILVKYYRFEETADNQEAIKGIAKVMMMAVLARVGPLLSQLPTGSGKNAGPPFEIYTLPSLPNDRIASLTILRERVDEAKTFAGDLATRVPKDGILLKVAEALGNIRAAIPE